MKRLVSVVLLAAALAIPGHAQAARVIYGEFQVRAGQVANISPPTRLDVLMYRGNLDGLTYWQRCANMGGYIVFETWQGRSEPVCRGVDY